MFAMEEQGWITLHRKIKDHWLYPSNREFTEYEAWTDILLSVNHSPQKVLIKGHVFVCGRGQSLNSLETWAARWRWHKSKVRRFFLLLKNEKMIDTLATHKTTQLTVCKYDSYQASPTPCRQDFDTLATPNNNIKIKELNSSFVASATGADFFSEGTTTERPEKKQKPEPEKAPEKQTPVKAKKEKAADPEEDQKRAFRKMFAAWYATSNNGVEFDWGAAENTSFSRFYGFLKKTFVTSTPNAELERILSNWKAMPEWLLPHPNTIYRHRNTIVSIIAKESNKRARTKFVF
jgi:hypothetical protein